MDTTSNFHLFGPPGKKDPSLKDLLFKDSAVRLKRIPRLMDSQLYLGFKYYGAIQSLQKGRQDTGQSCCVTASRVEELGSASTSGNSNTIFSNADSIVCKTPQGVISHERDAITILTKGENLHTLLVPSS